jgi:hypothetical protein
MFMEDVLTGKVSMSQELWNKKIKKSIIGPTDDTNLISARRQLLVAKTRFQILVSLTLNRAAI